MNKRLFVAGLPFSTTDEELKTLFAGIGNVVSANIITDRDTGMSKGFGFVEMEKEEDVAKAITEFNDSDFGGRKLVVNEARPREPRSDEASSGRQRFGGRKRGGFRGKTKPFGERREGGRGNFGRDGKGSGRRGYCGKH